MSGEGDLAQRRSGVLVHLSSLPGERGNGDLGRHARDFIDWLARSGFTIWQMLPLGPTHDDLCPYQCLSVHAGDPGFIDLDALVDAGYLNAQQLRMNATEAASRESLRAWRQRCLQEAYAGFMARDQGDQGDQGRPGDQDEQAAAAHRALATFREQHRHWLEDYALYMALRCEQQSAPWWEWPAPLRDRQPEALDAARERLAEAIGQIVFEQYLFFEQWAALRDHARTQGVQLFGDMPIFVAHDSAEVWAHRDCFDLNADGHPQTVAGVPPDYFSADGQRWGNPHYDWQQMAADGFRWWLERLATQLELFDFLRLDHFRGLAAYWSIPVTAATARDGHWVPAPGDELLEAIRARFGAIPLVAEDLGVITDDVVALRERYALPGMKVLQFAFDSDAANPYLPHRHEPASVVYTGTHDNDTTLGWYQQLDAHVSERLHAYLGYPQEPMPWPLIRSALASVATMAVVPMQDLLALDSTHRMNVPGVAEGNWRWRFEWEWLPAGLDEQLLAMNRLYGRC
ncbi:4-alpha-glucanotransferase [Halorhodospira abdelmalekii]|uniref:4-alpha-glucanotransferase n=1 Tax=Halorhodospira abdelmalekii TaxID=421629 RepID=UPI001906A9B1|nr:4-alpha-glucanotransferase [Halorhodospira abdelmalekii]MBK1734164.1 4-alpha-glucanotransferase [Halorhodospira abdelmalekii]